MLGHADGSTTLKHYIYNIEDNAETEERVLAALEGAKSPKSDQNIIRFLKQKRAENIEISTLSAP